MPRQPRFVLVGHPQHVIIRGNNRDLIFYATVIAAFISRKVKKRL